MPYLGQLLRKIYIKFNFFNLVTINNHLKDVVLTVVFNKLVQGMQNKVYTERFKR